MTASQSAPSAVVPADPGSRENPIAPAEIHKRDLKRFAFALHYVEFIRGKTAVDSDEPNAFTSMERDLLAYQFQYRATSRATLRSHCLSTKPIPVVVHLPEFIDFNSEGMWRRIKPRNRILHARALVSCTDFPPAGIRVWHIVLTPVTDFSVYDVIALIHLYDGRSESTDLAKLVRFQVEGNESPVDVKQLPGKLVPPSAGFTAPTTVAPSGGTVEIIVTENGPLAWLEKARRGEKAAEEGELTSANEERFSGEKAKMQGKLKPFAGIVTGIFDFDEIDSEEILDTFEPTFPESKAFLKISRCTFICITRSDRAMEASKEKIGISPYLLMPHSVLLHNEFLISNADSNLDGGNASNVRTLLKSLKRNEKSSWDPRKVLSRLFGIDQRHNASVLRDAVDLLAAADKYMKSNYLPNVFNYVTERTLYEKGTVIRGVTDMRALVTGKLEDYRDQIAEAQRKGHEWRQSFIASILAVTLIGQINGIFWGPPEDRLQKWLIALAMVAFWIFNMRMRAPESRRQESASSKGKPGPELPEDPEVDFEMDRRHTQS